jgi:transposase
MKILSQLDELNLDAAAKTQVAALVQSLLDQVKMDAETLQAKDLKIQALILELAHLRRLR